MAVDCCPDAVRFFDLVLKLYVHFAQTAHRWKALTDALSKKLGRQLLSVCATRDGVRVQTPPKLFSLMVIHLP